MRKFGLIRLRSALSAGDATLKSEEKEFLAVINKNKQFSFEKPKPGLPNVFFVQTGGSEIYFKDCYENFPEPYCLLVQGRRNSLAASLEIKTFLAQKKKRCLLIMGNPKQCAEQLERYGRFYEVEQKLNGMKLGVIGRPSDWLIASSSDTRAIKKRFGIDLVRIPMKEFLEAVDERYIENPEDFARFLKKTSRREDLRKSLYIHGALKKLCRKYGLSGFTLRCFDLLKAKQETSCLAFATLNDEGIISCCEGDVPTLITMAFCQALVGQVGFMANPSEFDLDHDEAIFAHCTCPLTMVRSYTLATHFESGLGFGIRGEFPEGDMTLVKVSPDLKNIRAMELSMLDNPLRPDLCRSQIHVRFDESMKPLVDEPYGNHVVFVYGKHRKEFEDAFAYLDPVSLR